MNNGNLLNNLLGLTGANSSATKLTVAKTRAESSEKFQQALEQARPEVAARKPVVLREPAKSESSGASRTPKPSDQRPLQHEPGKADTRVKSSVVEKKTVDKTADKTEQPVRASTVDEPLDTYQETLQPTDEQDQVVAEESQEVVGQVTVETSLKIDNLLFVDSAVTLPDQSSEFLVADAEILNSADAPLIALGEAADETNDVDNLLNLAEVTDDGLLWETSGGLAAQASLAALSIEVVSTGSSGELPSVATVVNNPPASGQNALGATSPGVIITAQVDGQPLATQILSNDLIGKVTKELVTDSLGAEPVTEGELTGEAVEGENPDFLLLNSKAMLNKLADANVTASTLDKAAPAADLAKPAPINAAIETLTRLTEAQSPAARAFVVQTGVPVPVGSPQWSQAVGDKVLWLAAQNVSSAEIRLDPPELGPMQVKVSVNQDQTSITFTSPHPAVREALDQQLHRLREMFSDQGLNLVNVDVSDKSFAQQDREQEESAKNQAGAELDDEELAPVTVSQTISIRLVDHYA